jgi:predicted nucleic acid-binding Zn ribbon protein
MNMLQEAQCIEILNKQEQKSDNIKPADSFNSQKCNEFAHNQHYDD